MSSLYKTANITVVADGLYTSFLAADFFQDCIGEKPKSVIQISDFAVFEYERYKIVVQVDARRLIAVDNGLQGSTTSAAPAAIKKFLERGREEIKVQAVGLNYAYELQSKRAIADVLLDEYFNRSSAQRIGEEIEFAGLKLAARKDGYVFQVGIEPVWQKPFESVVSFNYHFDSKSSVDWPDIVDRFNEFAFVVPDFLSEMIDAAAR